MGSIWCPFYYQNWIKYWDAGLKIYKYNAYILVVLISPNRRSLKRPEYNRERTNGFCSMLSDSWINVSLIFQPLDRVFHFSHWSIQQNNLYNVHYSADIHGATHWCLYMFFAAPAEFILDPHCLWVSLPFIALVLLVARNLTTVPESGSINCIPVNKNSLSWRKLGGEDMQLREPKQRSKNL